MKVALVIPSYNSSKFLSNCVQSAAAQSYDDLKIYIYDNNSTDGSYEMANNLASQSDIIDVVQVENIYKNSYREAFDHSFQNLDFDYITFLAADDYIEFYIYHNNGSSAGVFQKGFFVYRVGTYN